MDRLGSISKTLGQFLERKGKKTSSSIEMQKRDLNNALKTLRKKLLIVIDDIDRLRRDEVQDVMRLVRLVAGFPFTIYLLAFDRARVEDALSGVEGDGRAYLEKILQVLHHVPEIHEPDLAETLICDINRSLEGQPHGPIVQEDFDNVFNLVIRPLFRTLRDVRRYTNVLPVTLQVIGDEIALVDVLAMEAIRILVPDVFEKLPSAFAALTSTHESFGSPRSNEFNNEMTAKIHTLIESSGKNADAIREMCKRLFPACRKFLDNYNYGVEHLKIWRKNRRIAHPEILRFYLDKALSKNAIPAGTVKKAFDTLGDETALRSLVNSLPPHIFEILLERLEDYEDEYPQQSVGVAVEVLMSQYPRLRPQRAGMWDFGAEIKLSRVILRLLRRVEHESERTTIVDSVLPKLESLSAKLELINLVGHTEHVGHNLIPLSHAQQLEEQLRSKILTTSPEILAIERDLAFLLQWAARPADEAVRSRLSEIVADDAAFLQLLRNSLTATHAQGVGDVAVRREDGLMWDALISLFGEEVVRRRISEVASTVNRQSLDQRAANAITLAERYSEGWRPPRS